MEKTQNSKLFFICPFCQMEEFIRSQFGDVYFVTAPAAIFDLQDKGFIREIRYFITRKNITDIYTVCDLDCNFLNRAIKKKEPHGLNCERVIEALKSRTDDHLSLAKKIVQYQVYNLQHNSGIGAVIGDAVNIHSMVTLKKEKKLIYKGQAV